MRKKHIVKTLVFVILIACLLEVFVCNFSYFRYRVTDSCNPTVLDLSSGICGEGLQRVADSTFEIVDDSDNYLLFENMDIPVDSIMMDVVKIDSKEQPVKVYFEVTDEGNTEPYKVKEADRSHNIVSSVEMSTWMETEFYGNLHSLKIYFQMKEGDRIAINSLSLNHARPFTFHVDRVCLIGIILILAYVYRPKSRFYAFGVAPMTRQHLTIIGLVVLLNIVAIGTHLHFISNHLIENQNNQTLLQYSSLARSITEGKFYLDRDAEGYLVEMENPYDTAQRDRLAEESGENYLWDTAFFDGKYYVYFGVLPALLFQLPYYMITGKELLDVWPAFLICIGIFLSVYRLLYVTCKRWFPNTPFILYLLAGECLGVCCGTFFLMSDTGIYEIVIALGLLLAMTGFSLWLQADLSDFRRNLFHLALGSTLIALIMACRPPLFFIFFIAFVLFYELLFCDGKIVIHKNMKQVIAFLLPFVIVAGFIMYYNYARFGSVFDFGANYNLTTNDMTRRGFRMNRVGYGIWYYFFQPFQISSIFPFFKETELTSEYLGVIIRERGYGGCLWITPITLFGGLLVMSKNKILEKKNKLYPICIGMILISVIVAALDSNIAGYVTRYFFDFLWMLIFISIMAVFAVYEYYEGHTMKNNEESVERLHQFVSTSVLFMIVSIIFMLLITMSDSAKLYLEYASDVFVKMKYFVSIWK